MFLVSANVPIEKAFRIKCWVNFDGVDVVWSPERIMVYKPKSRNLNVIPTFGHIGKYFEKVNSFKISGALSLSGEVGEITALSCKELKELNFEIRENESLLSTLKNNFLIDTLWVSIFSNHPWSFCNRTARLALGSLTISIGL